MTWFIGVGHATMKLERVWTESVWAGERGHSCSDESVLSICFCYCFFVHLYLYLCVAIRHFRALIQVSHYTGVSFSLAWDQISYWWWWWSLLEDGFTQSHHWVYVSSSLAWLVVCLKLSASLEKVSFKPINEQTIERRAKDIRQEHEQTGYSLEINSASGFFFFFYLF